MKLTDAIKTKARTPQEALLMIAESVDALWAALDAQTQRPADPWQQPLMWAQADVEDAVVTSVTSASGPVANDPKLLQAIAACEAKLAECTDGEEAQAIGARLRILRDQAGIKAYEYAGSKMGDDTAPVGREAKDDQPFTTQGSMTQEVQVVGGVVDLPVVSPERQQARFAWAFQRQLWNFLPLDEQQACDTYAKGGPMWLYISNPKAVMAMPYEWRRELVEEIHLDSPKQAIEVGRDILKNPDSVPFEDQVNTIETIRGTLG